ncbi:hypothetical protein PPROV_000288500 [Pycnococcus provasolii]|uniref:Uncharacterized protein n=1 Tax=Pycnococcus provasolii TaxID=41880 RepID=A0A830HEU4_9CHLO|nr:hypothetical protein PPROV_000288500 [Pycnococcus provasolii]
MGMGMGTGTHRVSPLCFPSGVGTMAATGTRRTVAPQASSIIPPSLRSTVYRIVPPASLPSKPMLLTLIPWGATLGLGAIWMVQPWGWLQEQVGLKKPEE